MSAAAMSAGVMLLLPRASVVERRLAKLALNAVAASPPRPRIFASAGVVVGSATAFGLVLGGLRQAIAFGALAAAVQAMQSRRAAGAAKRQQQRVAAAVAPCADLLAACLHAGATAEEAVASVAEMLGDPLQDPLARVASGLHAGLDPEQAWALADDAFAVLAPVGRAFVRAARTGAPLAGTMSALADEQRRVRRWRAEAAARRAGVLAVAPLVLCFLPAFILVGVVPVVVGVASQALTGY